MGEIVKIALKIVIVAVSIVVAKHCLAMQHYVEVLGSCAACLWCCQLVREMGYVREWKMQPIRP